MRITLISAFLVLASVSLAQKPTDVKGQQQLAGGTAEFGTTYSLKNGFNFAILSGRYTLEPYNAYYHLSPKTAEKLVVLDIAVKNASQSDNFFNIDSMFTLVDDKNQLYPGGSLALVSSGNENPNTTLRPGQGLGQADLKDPLRVGFLVPNSARITKIMVNVGRLNTKEDVVRYMLVAPPKAGTTPMPKTFLAPLPDAARDPSDAWGAAALEEAKGVAGTYYPSGAFDLRMDEVVTTTDPVFNGAAPDDGKKYVSVKITARHGIGSEQSVFEVYGGDGSLFAIKDGDSEVYRPIGYRKVRADEDIDHTFSKLGDEYSFRVFFALPKDAKPKTFTLAAGEGHKWVIDLP